MTHMARPYRLICLFCCFVFLINIAHTQGSNSQDEIKRALQTKWILNQTWLQSQNFAAGLTTEKDPYQALVWQYLYVTLLPRAYPGAYSMLAPYKQSVAPEQVDQAYDLSKLVRKTLNFPARLDEQTFIKVFRTKEKSLHNVNAAPKRFESFALFLEEVKKHDPVLAEEYKLKLKQLQQIANHQVIFGKLEVNGAPLPESISRNQPIDIDKSGFFLGAIQYPFYMSAQGFSSFVLADNYSAKPKSLGLVTLDKLPKKQLSTLVGSIEPSSVIKDVFAALVMKGQYLDRQHPWKSALIPVTKLSDGHFYIKGLSPGAYELLLIHKGKKQSVSATLSRAAVKTLKPIRLDDGA